LNQAPWSSKSRFDPRSNEIHALIAGIEFAVPLSEIPEEDFESASPIIGFAIRCEGAVVVCKHRDGSETWVPADMWLP
jgi:hypothetical protein